MVEKPQRVTLQPGVALARQLADNFEMSDDERQLAATILGQRPNLWVYRPSRKDLAGDFLVVDRCVLAGRRVWVFELKQHGGSAGNQLQHAHHAVEALDLVILPVECIDATEPVQILRRLGIPTKKQRNNHGAR